jgi:hypothetical protein
MTATRMERQYISSLKTYPYMDSETKDHEKTVHDPAHTTPPADTESERIRKEKEAGMPPRENKK